MTVVEGVHIEGGQVIGVVGAPVQLQHERLGIILDAVLWDREGKEFY